MSGRFERCLVTGGGGFIGVHLAQRLTEIGHDVTILDNRDMVFDEGTECRFVKGDIRDEAQIRRLVAEHDCVYHMAALLGVRRTLDAPAEMLENNVLGTLHVLRAALAHGKKVVFASTSEAYGKGRPPFDESADLVFGPTEKLRWSYAIGKTLEEYLCLGYAQKGLPVTIVRYFNVYGPRQKEGLYGGVVPKFITAALRGDDITVYGDGTQTRSFTYIGDAVRATIAAMRREADGHVVNIGSADEIAIGELASTVKRLSGSSSSIVMIPYDRAYPKGFEEIPRRVPSVLKAELLLGVTPKVTLEVGLRRTIAWFRQAGGFMQREERS